MSPAAQPNQSLPWPIAADLNGWRFSHAESGKPGESFNSILKVADTTASDLNFAGLIVRCAPKGKIELLIALIEPLPPKTRPQVTITSGATIQSFEGTMAAAGAAILLPDEAANLTSGPWQSLASASFSVKDGSAETKGMVALGGLRPALDRLVTSCAQP